MEASRGRTPYGRGSGIGGRRGQQPGEFTPAQAREWIDDGDVPEVARAEHVDFVDIDSGHWPMITKPVELARLLAAAAVDA